MLLCCYVPEVTDVIDDTDVTDGIGATDVMDAFGDIE